MVRASDERRTSSRLLLIRATVLAGLVLFAVRGGTACVRGGPCDFGACADSVQEDAHAEVDTGGEAGIDGQNIDAQASPYCSTHLTERGFCEDFDDGTPLEHRWRIVGGLADAGTVFFDTRARSLPTALRIGIPGGDAGGNPSAYLLRTFSPPQTNVHLEFDVMPTVLPAAWGSFFVVEFGTTAISFVTAGGQWGLVEYGGLADGGILAEWKWFYSSNPTVGVWYHFEVDLNLGPKPAVTVKLDGASALDSALVLPGYTPGASFSAGPGIGYTQPELGAREWLFDNVLVTFP